MTKFKTFTVLSLVFPAVLLFLLILTSIVKPGFGNGCATGSPLMLISLLVYMTGYIPGIICGLIGVIGFAFELKKGERCKIWLVLAIIGFVSNAVWMIFLINSFS